MAEEDRRNVIGEISTGSVHRGDGRNEMNRETKEKMGRCLACCIHIAAASEIHTSMTPLPGPVCTVYVF